MRLTAQQTAHILACTREIMGHDANVTLFGSRLDDSKRGGDLDLLIETEHRTSLLQRARLKQRLEQSLNLPVDILARTRNTPPNPLSNPRPRPRSTPAMNHNILRAEREHLSKLLEAIQRCVFFLHQTQAHIEWPLSGEHLETHKKDLRTFESLAALNERFAKLQDTLASAMRHSALLMSEPTDSFLKVLALFEKLGVIDSIDTWQLARTARNLAAHDYEIDYDIIAEHFNTLHELSALLNTTAHRLLETCRTSLNIEPISDDFAAEFASITQPQSSTAS